MNVASSLEAGKIALQVCEETRIFVEVGKPLIEICDFAENKTRELGGVPAFPCNVAINEVAAHYTSHMEDMTTIGDNDLVKVDIGVHVDGYIADTAITICFDSGHDPLIKAAEVGLDVAIKAIRAGVPMSRIRERADEIIRQRGFTPIRNLSSHRMARHLLHAEQHISNILEDGEVYAIEPFSTPPDATGIVVSGPPSNIYIFRKKRRLRSGLPKQMLKFIRSEYRTLPFASRWVLREFRGEGGIATFDKLLETKCIYSYPQLVEKSGAVIAQAEHTVMVTNDGCIITTDKNQSSVTKVKT